MPKPKSKPKQLRRPSDEYAPLIARAANKRRAALRADRRAAELRAAADALDVEVETIRARQARETAA